MNGITTTSFVYDGDGNRVQKTVTINDVNTTTTYVGKDYEVTGNAATSYYYFGSQRVAMRNGSGVTYLYGDHLGSTSVALKPDGSTSKQKYYPFGGVRIASGSMPTDYGYTAQRADNSLGGLMYYGDGGKYGRFYDPLSGRFIQPDVIIPAPTSPQNWNRFTYVTNNPLRYNDPNGHCPFCITAAIGAVVGGTVDLGYQMIVEGKSFDNVDWGKVAGAAVGGAVFGATMGLAAPIGLGATLVAGAGAGVISGQASRFTEATWNEAADLLHGQGIDGQHYLKELADNGILDGRAMVIDAASGTVSAFAGRTIMRVFSKAGLTLDPDVAARLELHERVMSTDSWAKYDLARHRWSFQLSQREITFSETQMQRLLELLSKNLYDEAADFIAEVATKPADEEMEKLQ